MNIILYKDTFKIIKTPKKQYDDINAIAYLFDISTDRKGPVFTIVRNPVREINHGKMSIVMDTTYAPIDIPFCDSTMFNSYLDINSVESYYNIYPLIKQMIAFNSFIESYGYIIDNQLCIDTIMIEYGSTKIRLDEFSSDKKIKKTFKYLSMLTNVDEFMDGNRYIVFYNNGYWKFASDVNTNNKKIKYIFAPINDTECGYLFTRKEFKIFESILELNISLIYNLKNIDESISMFESNSVFDMGIPFDTFDGILDACIFIPQLILIEKGIYHESIDLDLAININDSPINLIVTDSEMSSNGKYSCIFKLIRDLMKFKL